MDRAAFSAPFHRLRPFLFCFVAGLALLTASRIALSIWLGEQVGLVDGTAPVFVGGLRVDIATLCGLLGPVAALWLLAPARIACTRAARTLVTGWLTLVLSVLALLELATPTFIAEYGLRPNRLFLEYLIYPIEIAKTVLRGHPLSTGIAVVVVALIAWITARWMRVGVGRCARTNAAPIARLLLACAVLVVATLGARGTLGHRPMNPAMLAFSSDPTVNTLPLNSTYAVFFAARDLLIEEPGAELYGQMPLTEIVAEVRREMALPADAFVDSNLPTLARRAPSEHPARPLNLVIVLEESLGAQFIGSLGGRPLSPNFDALAAQGWAFDRLYATGTRSVRGIEAVLTGFTPTPAQAVVKQPLSQQGFFTLAALLRNHGYDTTFYYGGESHFDNMRGFFLGNGFERIVDQNDYPEPVFTGSWGVSDEDLFDNANSEFTRLHAAGTPFFGLVFSSSNHDPFEFPDGRIALYEEPKQTRNNAAKYADHALGTFFAKAKASDYWNDTVFLVVADHDSRVTGRTLVPIDNFHIPGLILGPGIAPRRDLRIVSQVDLAPTLLSLLGIADPTPMTGQDLTDPTRLVPGRAMLQYDGNFAWMQGEHTVILQPGKPPAQFRYLRDKDQLVDMPLDPALATQALAQALWASHAYRERLYRLPGTEGAASP